jgi:primosomal protein N' (replication factor Y) (superfamily II helicase)
VSLSLYFHGARRLFHADLLRSKGLASTVYANVIVDIQARELKDKLFTYKVPEELVAETFIGAQVLVPFGGRDLVGGYVVSLTDEAKTEVTIKEIAEVIEPEPLFDKEYVEFLYWIADYYCASLSDVISAAVPSVLSAKFKRIVRLNKAVLDKRGGALTSYEPASQAIIRSLLESKNLALSMVALKQRWRRAAKARMPVSNFYRALGLLRNEGVLSINQESTNAQAPRVVTTVIWTGEEGSSARQKGVLNILAKHGGQMTMKDLLEQAKTTSATIKKFAQSGLVSINHEESFRDPLSSLQVTKTTNADLALTDDQEKALAVLSRELTIALKRSASTAKAEDSIDPTSVHPTAEYGSHVGSDRTLKISLVGDSEACANASLAAVSDASSNLCLNPKSDVCATNLSAIAECKSTVDDNLSDGSKGGSHRTNELQENNNGQPDNIDPGIKTIVGNVQIIDGTVVGLEDYPAWLLHGVTGSGKTEVYLRLIEQTLAAGRAAMMLVPEISLTPQLARRLKGRFGDQVSVWHSGITPGEKYDTWRRLRSGEGRVLLGARSAILANLPQVGLIILDEEHDGSYKQTSPSPRYNAKDVAIEKGRRTGAMVVLGSATPDVSVYLRAQASNKVLELPERVFKQAMPLVRITDMRKEFANGNKSIFSLSLSNELTACLERKEQAILLINRRGYASHVFCRACGFVVKCRNCSVALVFHQQTGPNRNTSYLAGFLACHHCGFRCSAMEECPSCKSPFIKQYGLGTQRVEEEVKERYPESKILRLDSDVTTRKGAHDEILQSFAQGEADILIGTQMVSKGLDIANVTLVGVMTADAAFNLPDYRSTERGFQLLTQVSGRAGRGERPGVVILQTYDCEMPALEWSKDHNYAKFLQEELEARQAFLYPPFSQIIRVVVAGDEPGTVETACKQLADEISQFIEETLPEGAVQVLGPAACLIERLRGKFRYHLLLKNLAGDDGRQALTAYLRNKFLAAGLNMAVDVDALDLV